jgi:hypothetical protein
MKKNELKELINPIVKECVNENIQTILLESGLLSQVISEVVKGLKPTLTENRVETKIAPKQIDESFEREENHMREIMKRSKERKVSATNIRENSELLSSRLAFKGVNIFEGIKDTIPEEPVSAGPGSAMSGIAPDDPGVDISGLFDQRIANALLKGKK